MHISRQPGSRWRAPPSAAPAGSADSAPTAGVPAGSSKRSPGTRLPIVELADAAKAEVASALAAIGDEDLGCPVESWHGRGLHSEVAATS